MVNNGLYTSRHWGMLLWSAKRNWRDVLLRLNHSLSTLLSNALTPTTRPVDRHITPPVGETSWQHDGCEMKVYVYNKAQGSQTVPS